MSGGDTALVVGGDGLIGRHLAAHLTGTGWQVTATSRRPGSAAAPLDLAKAAVSPPRLPRAEAVVLVAAIARLADCAAAPRATAQVNVFGTAAVARAAAAAGAFVLLLSSDKVFDGGRARAMRTWPISPATEYGRQKAAAEAAVLALGPQGAVLRLSKIVAPELTLFANWAAALRQGRPIAPYRDMFLAPVPVGVLAQLVAAILGARQAGIHHLSGAEDGSYARAGAALAQALRADPALVVPGEAAPALHPPEALVRHSTLDMSAEFERFAIQPPGFEETLAWLAERL